MVTCVWRMSGTQFEPRSFLKANPNLVPDLVCIRGEAGRLGKVETTSGLNVTLAEAPDIRSAVELLGTHAWLTDALQEAEKQGAESCLDFSILMSEENASAEITLPIDVLGMLHKLKTEIVFSVYLSRDGADDDNEDLR